MVWKVLAEQSSRRIDSPKKRIIAEGKDVNRSKT